jgi:hypothetical protein
VRSILVRPRSSESRCVYVAVIESLSKSHHCAATMYLPAIWPLDDTDVMHYVCDARSVASLSSERHPSPRVTYLARAAQPGPHLHF